MFEIGESARKDVVPPDARDDAALELAIALLAGITSNIVNSMVTMNLPSLAGSMGLYVAEVARHPGIYVSFNATANLSWSAHAFNSAFLGCSISCWRPASRSSGLRWRAR